MNARTDSIITKEQMLACPGVMPAPRNQWYIAALSGEVSRKVMKRQILQDHIVFFRTEDGAAVALADRCPHRGVPLSMGTVQGNGIRCAYHGFEFGKAGICTHIPSQTTIVDQLAVRSYPLFEVGSYIWFWMGLPAERDDSLLPDMYALGLTRPGYRVTPLFVMEIGCNFQMLHENLLDTSHITFLHPGMIDGGNMATASFNTSYKNGRVTISRDITETPTAPMPPRSTFARKWQPWSKKNAAALLRRPCRALSADRVHSTCSNRFPEITYGIWPQTWRFTSAATMAKSTLLAALFAKRGFVAR